MFRMIVVSVSVCCAIATTPCGALTVIAGNSPYPLDYVEATSIFVSGTTSTAGTLDHLKGGYGQLGVYVDSGGTLRIYGSHVYTNDDVAVQVGVSAFVTLFADSATSIKWNDGVPPFDSATNPTKIVPPNGSAAKLTWVHNAEKFSLKIGSSSDILLDISSSGPEPGVDIKPGSDDNTINLGSNGVIPVAILSGVGLDATTVIPESVYLTQDPGAGEGVSVAVRGKGNKDMAHAEDVNGDGYLDLVIQVETENLREGEFQEGEVLVRGTGEDGDGNPVDFEFTDTIRIVPAEDPPPAA